MQDCDLSPPDTYDDGEEWILKGLISLLSHDVDT